ncbi:MAG: T9SS type A sorting domain-containing protein [Bacteroidetes bacterium]|nr:T9SS type A sorting domain-containing protein [Bacteroidota bacterium]
MSKKLYAALLFWAIFISTQLVAGKFYWVGGNGFWDYQTTQYWSLTSGGTGFGGVPGPNDTVYFDANSFAGTFGSATVAIYGSSTNPVKVHTIDFTGVTDNPTLSMGANDNLEIFGSVILDSLISVSVSGNVTFKSAKKGNIINLFDRIVNFSSIIFDGPGGEWTLGDSLLSNAAISLFAGNIITNGYNIRCNTFTESDMGAARGIQLSNGSKIISTGGWNFNDQAGTLNFVMDAGTTIIMKNPGSLTTFDGGGLTYANVAFMGMGGSINGANYYDTLSVHPQSTLTIPSDIQHFNAIMSYAAPGVPASVNGGASPIVLYDQDGGLNCLNYTDLFNIDAQGPAGTTYSSYAGTNSGVVTGVSVATPTSFTYAAYKTANCADGNDAAVAVQGSGGIAPYTFQWLPGNYVGDTLKTAIGGTTYTINMKDVCHAVYTSTVYANGLPDNVVSPTISNDSVLCYGQGMDVFISTISTGVNYSWSPAAGLSSTNSNYAFANPTATTTYTVTMSSGTCVKSLTIAIKIENPKAVLSPDSMVVCSGSEFVLDGGSSTGIINYPSWGGLEIADFTDSLRPKIVEKNIGGIWYYLSLSGKQCSSMDSIYVDIVDSIIKIHGNITYDNGTGTVTKGYVKLFKDTSIITLKGKLQMIDSVLIQANGSYAFDSTKIKPGYYFISAYPDPVMYPRVTPMYYLDPVYANDTCTFYWDSAYAITANCADDLQKNIDIDQLPDLTTMGGKAVVNGHILEGAGYVELGKGKSNFITMKVGDPVKGVGVGLGKKPNPSANIIATAATDTSGFYQFKNIPPGNYVIFADIPGLPMDSTYEINITGVDSVPDMDYYVNDSIIYIDISTTSVKNISGASAYSVFKVYPNPYNGAVTFHLSLNEKSAVAMEVFNLLGEKISTLERAVLNEGDHRYSFSAKDIGLSAGIYVVKLTVNNNIYTKRIVELK